MYATKSYKELVRDIDGYNVKGLIKLINIYSGNRNLALIPDSSHRFLAITIIFSWIYQGHRFWVFGMSSFQFFFVYKEVLFPSKYALLSLKYFKMFSKVTNVQVALILLISNAPCSFEKHNNLCLLLSYVFIVHFQGVH